MRKTACLLFSLALCSPPVVSLAQEADVDPPAEGRRDAPNVEKAPPDDPDWFDKMLAREVEPYPVTELASSDGAIRARVPAKIQSGPQLVEGNHYVQLDAGMGREGPVECWLFGEDRDLAASLTALSGATFDQIGTRFGPIEVRAVQRVHAGSVGAQAYMGVDWIYRVKTEKGPLAGQVKHRIASKDGRAVYCQHSAVGYAKAFQGVFEMLINSVQYQDAPPSPDYVEIHVASIKEQRVGVSRTAHSVDEEGDIKIVTVLSMLIPVDQEVLRAQDNVTVEFSRPDGSIINKLSIETESGETMTNLTLDPGTGTWAVEGLFQGKPLEATFDYTELRSDLGQRWDLARFLEGAKQGESIGFPDWSDEFDPTRLIDIRITYLEPHELGSELRFAAGPLHFDAVVDAGGSPIAVKLPVGPVELQLARIHVEGSLPVPPPDPE